MRLDLKLSKKLLYDKTFEDQRFTATDGIKLSEYIDKHSRDAEWIYGDVEDVDGDGELEGIHKMDDVDVVEDMPLLLRDGLGRYFVFRLLLKTEKDGTNYCVFEPLTRFVNFEEEDVVVFRLCFDGDGSEYFAVETDDEVADSVMDELGSAYSDFCDQDFLKELLDPVTGDKLKIDYNGMELVYRRLAIIYRDGRYYGVLEAVLPKAKDNPGPEVFKIDMLNVWGMDLLYDDKLEKQIMDEYESTRRK
ncbi:MAG: hypothetical protein LUD47_07265 [Clostridia bacterium]|nr:hypothetical protein [Clostridia bacterium]